MHANRVRFTIQNKTNWAILHNKFPPTPRVGLVCLAFAKRIAQLSFFFLRRSFFAVFAFCGGVCASNAGRLTQPPLHDE